MKFFLVHSQLTGVSVVQGDIVSTLYFILALEMVLKRHDKVINKGVNFGGRRVHALGYADDWTTTATRQPTE